MGGLLKNVLLFLLGIVALLVIATIAVALLFDPNDLRDDIAAGVQQKTGRELVIEGDLELSLFPWLAIDVGKTTLGNAPGFGDEPFASFEQARLSVKLLPMLLRREVEIGTAALESLQLNLEVAANGRSNWQDLIEASEASADAPEEAGGESAGLEIGGIDISEAAVIYADAELGETYRLTNLNLRFGRIASGEATPLAGDFDFELQPADLAGDFEFETTMLLDSEAGTVDFSDLEITVLGVDMSVDMEPYSYVEDSTPTARIEVDAFSAKSLMSRLDIEPPVTADPDALGKVYGDALVRMTPEAITLSDLSFVVDDTNFEGEMALANDAAGTISFDLTADSMNLGRYMEPSDETAGGGGEAVPVEIPTDLLRYFEVRGSLALKEAWLSGMQFENVQLGLRLTGGRLRMHPMSADFFNGKYSGDVQINASGAVPSLSVNETVNGVDLGALAQAMFDQENITGKINGTFQLRGAGEDLAAIQRDLSGNMSMELLDGAFEGTDIWYELRRARALLKKEEPPKPTLPARTRFSTVRVTGPVAGGVFRSDDLFAELPFMQLTGKGSVDLPAAEIDYRLTARILERPEFAQGATEQELDEFTEAVIPMRVTGPLADPSIKPDLEGMLKEKAEEKIKDVLLDKLFGDEETAEEKAERKRKKQERRARKEAEQQAQEAEQTQEEGG